VLDSAVLIVSYFVLGLSWLNRVIDEYLVIPDSMRRVDVCAWGQGSSRACRMAGAELPARARAGADRAVVCC